MNTVVKADRPAEEKPRSPNEAVATVSNVEGEIREFVRRDVTGARKLPSVDPGEFVPGNLNFLIDRVSGPSIKELDHLIEELTVVRDYLQAEGERVQREVSNYAQVSQAAMASAKIILDSMGQWKTAVGSIRDRA
jgi:hypothetical protein